MTRSLRARPFSQQMPLIGQGRPQAMACDPQRELAWMQTGSGMQLISIQPVEVCCALMLPA